MTRKTLLTTSVLALSLLMAPPAGSVIPAGFSQVVIYASEEVDIKQDTDLLSGSVVVDDAGGKIKIGEDVTTAAAYDLKSDEVKIEKNTTIGGDVYYNTLDNKGTINGAQITPLSLPVFPFLPLFFTGPSDGPDIEIDEGASETLAAGDYGDIKVKKNATLIFSGGTYNIRKLETQEDVTIDFSAATAVRVAEKVKFEKRSTVGSSVPSSEVAFYIADDGGTIVDIKDDNQVNACFYAPAGEIKLGEDVIFTGALVGRKVKVEKRSQITLGTCFFNRPPVTEPDSAVTPEDASVDIFVLANDSDPNADNLNIDSTSGADFGTVVINDNGTPGDTNDDYLTYSPAPDSNDNQGNHSFSYTVCDDGVDPGPLCVSESVGISVTPINDQPTADATSVSTLEDTPVAITLTGGDSDPHVVQTLTFEQTSATTSGGVSGLPASDPASVVATYSPDADSFGADSFTFTTTDDATAGGPALTSAAATVSITVTSVNDPPVTAADGGSVDEDGSAITIDVLANDTAGPANELQTLNLTAVDSPSNGRTEIVGGQVEYTPNEDYFGADSFGYTACDDGDGADDPTEQCSSGTVTVTVNSVNDPPQADSQTVSTGGDVNLVITLTGSDPEGDALTFAVTVNPTAGAIVGAPTQLTDTSASVTYDPNGAGNVSDQFTFEVNDGNGGTATAFVSINPFEGCTQDSDCDPGFICNVSEGICEPEPLDQITAQAGDAETTTGEAVGLILQAAAPASVDDLTFSIVSGPTSGTLTPVVPIDPVTTPIRSAATTYTPTCTPTDPPEAPVCTASFDFQACEAAQPSNCDTATVTISVSDAGVAEPPVALDQTVTTGVGGSVTINLVTPASTTGEVEGRTCTQNAECASGFICDDGGCVPEP